MKIGKVIEYSRRKWDKETRSRPLFVFYKALYEIKPKSLTATFYAWFFKKNVSHVIFFLSDQVS